MSHNFTRVTYDSGTILHRGECPQVLHRYNWGGFMADRVCAADSLPCVRPKETRIGCRHDPITSGLPLIALSDAHPVAVIVYVSFHVDSCSYCDVLSHVSAFPGAPGPCHHHHCTARSLICPVLRPCSEAFAAHASRCYPRAFVAGHPFLSPPIHAVL